LQKYAKGVKSGMKRLGGRRVTVWYGIRLKCDESESSESIAEKDWNLEDIL